MLCACPIYSHLIACTSLCSQCWFVWDFRWMPRRIYTSVNCLMSLHKSEKKINIFTLVHILSYGMSIQIHKKTVRSFQWPQQMNSNLMFSFAIVIGCCTYSLMTVLMLKWWCHTAHVFVHLQTSMQTHHWTHWNIIELTISENVT